MGKQWDPLTDMPDLRGKVIVVTGASSGIGLQTVRLLSSRGARVFSTSRSMSSARKAQDKLQDDYPDAHADANVEWLPLDLADLKSITGFADELKSKTSKIDIFINNASASTPSTELVAGRWEQHMAINVAAPFLLVNRLLPLLEQASKEKDSDVRIVSISSIAHASMLPSNFAFPFNSPSLLSEPVKSWPLSWRLFMRFVLGFDMIRYAVSKAGVVIFAQELQRRLEARKSSILSLSVHPGEVNTEGVMSINGPALRAVARLSFLTAEQGAANPLFAATAKEVRGSPDFKGKFLVPVGKVGSPNPVVHDKDQVAGLWQNTTEQLNKQLLLEGLPALSNEW